MYPVFSYPPDLLKPPTRRVVLDVDIFGTSPAAAVVAWPNTRDETATTWRFSGETDESRAAFFDAFEAMGGQAGQFLMPSWNRDLMLTNEPPSGSVDLIAIGDSLPDISYPDRPGAFVFVYDPISGFHSSEVLRKVGTTYRIKDALPFDVTNGAIIGWMTLARFELDELTVQHLDEKHWLCEMPVRTVRAAVDLTREMPIEAVAGYRLWKAPTIASQTLVPRGRTRRDYGFTIGPPELSAEPTLIETTLAGDTEYAKYGDTWAAWVGSDGVYLAKRADVDPWAIADVDGVKSALFNKAPTAEHLALAFDENGDEVLAIEHREKVTIHGYLEGTPETWTFAGLSPQLLQIWTLPGEAYDRSDAEIVCIYMKRGHAAIFGRFESDGFETERTIAYGVNVPLYIDRLEFDGDNLKIVCIDDQWREMTLIADYSYTTENNTSTVVPFELVTSFTTFTENTLYTGVVHTVYNSTTNTQTVIGTTETLKSTLRTTVALHTTYTVHVWDQPLSDGFGNPQTDGMGSTLFTGMASTEALGLTTGTMIVVMLTTTPTAKFASTEVVIEHDTYVPVYVTTPTEKIEPVGITTIPEVLTYQTTHTA